MQGIKIALCGEMRSGKDTAGAYLIERYGFQRFAFGDGIREITRKLFPAIYEREGKPRKLLQDFGQFCVSIDENVWVDYTFDKIYEQTNMDDNIVITDLRQPHEYKALVDMGFSIVRVTADTQIRIQRMIDAGEHVTQETLNHQTEQHVRDFEVDFELENNTTPEDLYKQIDNMLLNLTGGEM